jgi:hypothetical protein
VAEEFESEKAPGKLRGWRGKGRVSPGGPL